MNDGPYGTERNYNGLRLAGSPTKREGEQVKVFLIGDAASCSKKNQKLPQGYYNIESDVQSVARHNAEIGVCGTCMDARGMTEKELIEGTKRSTLEELTPWIV